MSELLGNATGSTAITGPPNIAHYLEAQMTRADVTQEALIADVTAQIETAARDAFGQDYQFKAFIDEQRSVRIAQILTVVVDVTNEYQQVSLQNARKANPDIKLGTQIVNQLEYDELQTPFGVLAPVKTQIKNMSLQATNV